MSEPIDLDQLVVSLAAAMVNARRYLDQATLNMQDVYEASSTLAAMPRPRFNLDSVEFEVPYVVDDIQAQKVKTPSMRVQADVSVSERELNSLRRGIDGETQDRLTRLLADYRTVKAGLRMSAADTGRTPVKLRPAVELEGRHLQDLKTGASKTAVRKLDRLLEDYHAARTSLVRMREVITGGGVPRVRVRVDAASVQEAPEHAQHRVRLLFRSDTQEPVSVQDQIIT
jgi:hypothetical protein